MFDPPADSSRMTPLAVIGLGALFPGSDSPQSFWRDIVAGRDRITEVPPTHWLAEDFFDAQPGQPDKVYTTRGGYLGNVPFSPLEFGMPPNTLPATDTAQLLALVVAKRVLEDALGERFDSAPRSKISVILGVASATELVGHMSGRLQLPGFVRAMRSAGLDESTIATVRERILSCYVPWQESTFPGVLGNVVAGRVANRFDLGGTNVVLDAACASSLAAVQMGALELQAGRADIVLTGGVDALNDIFMHMCFGQTGALSRNGECRPFSSDSDGTLLGEGVGMFALERLEDAERNGHAIYAVLKGIGSSSDGRAKSIYAPRPEGQADALRRAYSLAGYSANTVELVEAHGTGTAAGDLAEFQSTHAVFSESGAATSSVALGTVKSQIGHTKAAAGAAGFIKTVMALHNKVLPPTIKVDAPNPRLELETSPLYINTEARPWIHRDDRPRRASVSAFGFGGTNFHATLEEYRGPAPRPARVRPSGSELVLLSAGDADGLRLRAAELAASKRPLRASARTSQAAFDPGAPARLAVVANDRDDLAEQLHALDDAIASGVERTTPRGACLRFGATELGQVAVLFPGQGSQYVGMTGAAIQAFDAVRASWDRAATVEPGLRARVFPPPTFTDDERSRRDLELTATEWAQPSIAVAGLGIFGILGALGVEPDAVAGHSLGEVTALAAAGVLSIADAVRVARTRGELMASAGDQPGSMIAVRGTIADVRAALERLGDARVVVANHNSPEQVVLSGPTAAVERAAEVMTDAGLRAVPLRVSTAFHSPVVAGAVDPFERALASFEWGSPRCPVYSNVTAAPYEDGDGRAQLASAIAKPVRFVEQIEAMYAAGVRTFIEVGPDGVLSRLVERCLKGRPHLCTTLDERNRDGLDATWRGLAKLATAGLALDFDALWADEAADAEPTADDGKRRMTVELCGSNYGKPDLRDLPPPPAEPLTRAPASTALPAPVPVPVPAPEPEPELALEPEPETMPVDRPSAKPSADAAPNRGLIDAHLEFQRMMLANHEAFLRMMTAPGEAATSAVRAPSPAPTTPSIPARTPAPAPVASPAAAPPGISPVIPVAVAAPAPASVVAMPAPVVAMPAPVVVAPTPVPAPGVDLVAEMLAVVADKTGYPTDMLDLSMEIEADLGIDSIKRVEILSAMRQRVPGLPEADPAKLAAMRTLAEIVDTLADGSTPAAAPNPVAAPAHATPTPAPAPGVDLVAEMLAVVADKTGYPADMLDLSMEIEADLGIDSIKRVEILSAMRQRVPGLPEADPAKLAAMRTLAEIVDTLGDGSNPAPAPTPVAAAPAPAPGVDLVAEMLAVVADKTGYPADMLDLSMEIEADLGIDSIKRVEILSAMRQRVPGLPEADPAKLAAMRTLAEIVDTLGDGSTPAAAPNPVAAPAAPAPTPAPGVDLVAEMLAVVADKTGYPADMLELSMEIEADLGIDSIKRVEILSAMRQRVPGLPKADPAKLAAMRTLAEIVDTLADGSSPAAAPSEEQSLVAVPAPGPALTRFVVRPAPAPAPGFASRMVAAARVHVLPDSAGLAEALADRLRAAGLTVDVTADAPAEAEAVIDLRATGPVGTIDAATADNQRAFALARHLAPQFAEHGGTLIFVQDTGGAFGFDADFATLEARAWRAGVAGLAKTAACEWPDATVRVIDLQVDHASGAAAITPAAERLADELLAGGLERELGLPADGRRLTLAAEPEPSAASEADALGTEPVFVVSGGARGVTADALITLAQTGCRPRLLVLGRTARDGAPEPAELAALTTDAELKRALLARASAAGERPSPRELGRRVREILLEREIAANFAALERAGAEVEYAAVDVRDREQVARAVAGARARWGRIDGLIHGAGVLADAKLQDKTDEQFERVFETKVLGLRALLDATADDELRWLCLFSSVAARSGNPGQADYAMANEVLNKVALAEAARRGSSCRVVSIGWGPWAGGMVTPALAAMFEARGVGLIPIAEGCQAFVDALTSPDTNRDVEIVVGAGLELSPGDAAGYRGLVAVDRERAPQLDDHRVRDEVVLPVVMVLEWFAELAKLELPNAPSWVFEDFRVLRGVVLDAFGERATELCVASQAGVDGGIELAVLDADGSRRHGAMLRAGPERLDAALPSATLPTSPWTPADVYAEGRLFHGPAFQAVERIDNLGADGASAALRGSADLGRWRDRPRPLDPAAVDGMLQLALLCGLQRFGGPSLPLSIARCEVSATPGHGPYRCQLRVVEGSNQHTRCDATLVDADGRVVVRLVGLGMYALPRVAAAE